MDKKLIMVLFLIFIVLFSFGCEKEEITEESPKTGTFDVEIPPRTLDVNNIQGGEFLVGELIFVQCGGEICSVYEREFTWAKVLKVESRILTLDTTYEKINVEIPTNIIYKKATPYIDPETEKIAAFALDDLEGDHFDEINENDLIGLKYVVNEDQKLTPTMIEIIVAEEVK